jgi:hypothetical protein
MVRSLRGTTVKAGLARTAPWVIAALCFVAFGASFSEVHRLKTRVGEFTHDHAAVRQFMIRVALSDADQPIVVIGDSVVEMAPLPAKVCGHPVVNAGIGGTAFADFIRLAPLLFEDRKPFLVVIGLGANERAPLVAQAGFRALAQKLEDLTRRQLAFSTSPDRKLSDAIKEEAVLDKVDFLAAPMPQDRFDGVHLTTAAYAPWMPALIHAMEAECEHSS